MNSKKPTVEVVNDQGNHPKVELKATKVKVVKTGMNSGIAGGGYQCC